MHTHDLSRSDLDLLLTSWELALRAERKSPQTIKAYGDGVRAYLKYTDSIDAVPDLGRAQVRAFVDAVLVGGAAASTAVSRQLAVRRFSAWLAEEGEIDRDLLVGLKPPKMDQPVVDPLTDDEVRLLLRACHGSALRERRDEAIIRFMVETGARASEVAAIALDDVDLASGTIVIRRGKGGKGRVVPIGAQTSRAIDRYIRTRRTHRLAATAALFLGDRGKTFTYDALYKTIAERARAAGVPDVHPHRFRHTAAHRWLAAGGSEGGLMAVAGWTRPDMLMRYTQARASERAIAEAATLNLGDL